MKKQMIAYAALSLLTLFSGRAAYAGGQEGTGGDICEDRFKIVRDDLKSWILAGGSQGLTLPEGVTVSQYNQSMLNEIANATIACTDDTVTVDGVQKTCENSVDGSGRASIVCNRNDFLKTPQADQYILVHHEYAGLAGFERSASSDSNYRISNQITWYLADQVEKKLVVKPAPVPNIDPFDPASCTGTQLSDQDYLKLIPLPQQTSKTIGQFKTYIRWRACYQVGGCTQWKNADAIAKDFSDSHATDMYPWLDDKGDWLAGSGDVTVELEHDAPVVKLFGSSYPEVVHSTAHFDLNFLRATSSPIELGYFVETWSDGHYDTYDYQDSFRFGGKDLVANGIFTDHCLRITATGNRTQLHDSSGNTYSTEAQYVFFMDHY